MENLFPCLFQPLEALHSLACGPFLDSKEKRKTGARGLNTVVDDTTWVAYRDAYSHDGVYDEIILTDETVKDPKVYKKVYKKEV